MLCPVCTRVDLVMTDRQGIEIDYCPTCRGVWLDRGELDKLIERSAAQVGNGAPLQRQERPPGRDGHRDFKDSDLGHRGQPGQRRSLWRDLFD